jgi:hypothetical protein
MRRKRPVLAAIAITPVAAGEALTAVFEAVELRDSQRRTEVFLREHLKP